MEKKSAVMEKTKFSRHGKPFSAVMENFVHDGQKEKAAKKKT